MGQDCKQVKLADRAITNCASVFRSLRIVTYPATSRVISRTKAVRLDRKPFLLEILGAGVLGVTSIHHVSLQSIFSQV
jgi:hypothetical protein